MWEVKVGPVDVFGFLTTEPNALVGAYHPKAMPVILTTPEECDMWMTAVGRHSEWRKDRRSGIVG